MGSDSNASDNRWLKEAHEAQVPVLYFLGVAPQRYLPLWPTYVAEWLPGELKVRLTFGMPAQRSVAWALPAAPEASVRLQVCAPTSASSVVPRGRAPAYENRCAITGMPEPRLLDAAHIIPDGDERLGLLIISNGLPLSKVHHAAFDAKLIGISPDLIVHVSGQLLEMNAGPMFEQGIKAIRGRQMRPPNRDIDAPDKDRLAIRFEEFLVAN